MYKSLLIAFLSLSSAFAIEKYTSESSTEAELNFSGKIELAKGERSKDLIDEQLQHLIGHFSSQSFQDSFGYPGVLSDDYKFEIASTKTLPSGRRLVEYTFKGKIVVHKKAFGSKTNIDIPLRLPLALDKVYDLGVVRGKNKCTDPHYNEPGDFFYFWDPDKSGCPLKGNDKDIVRVTGKATRLSNTTKTYPEFDRLYSQDKITASVFIGYIDDEPGRRNDDGTLLYQDLKKELLENGFKLVEEKKHFSIDEEKGVAHLSVFEKERNNALKKKQTVRVEVLLSDTDYGSDDETFRDSYLSALKKSDLVVYDGHSGLGANIGAEYLEGFALAKKYQVLFLNGCSSYPYFNGQYFGAKSGGSKNLEIITSGLSTYTTTAFGNMMAFLEPFLKGKITSYQTLLRNIELSNGDVGTYLTGVNGDEDNKFFPKTR
ncbi:MAG: hypothetical protein Fur0010_19130 [Bdellovibrio sp.]